MTDNRLKIVVLDDDLNDLRLMQRELSTKGYLVDPYSDPKLLLEKLLSSQGNYDVAILDYYLGNSRQTGLDVLREITTLYPHISTILVTAAGMDFATESLSAGAYRYITKPVDFDELTLAINFAAVDRQATEDYDDHFLQIFHELSTAINFGHKVEGILNALADHMMQLFKTARVWIVTFELKKQQINFVATRGYEEEIYRYLNFQDIVSLLDQPRSISQHLATSLNSANSTFRYQGLLQYEKNLGFISFALLPITIENMTVGLLSVVTKFTSLSERDTLHLQILAKQAGNAMATARKSRLVDSLTMASNAALSQSDPKEILQVVVQQALESLEAEWASVILVENNKPHEVASAGTPHQPVLSNYIRPDGHSAYAIKHNVVISVENIDEYNPADYEDIEINPQTIKEGYKSILGVPINIRGETLGVVWLHFKQPRSLTGLERDQFQIFINQMASVFDNARQLQYLEKIQRATGSVASLMNLDEFGDNLQQAVAAIRSAVDCDVVSLFTYNSEAGRLNFPPVLLGAKYPELAQRGDKVPVESIVYRILDMNSIYVVRTTNNAPLFKNSPFTTREGINSLIACPLTAHGRKVGVLFLNYLESRIFTENGLANIAVFSNLISTLIRNQQEYRRQRRRVQALKSIYDAGSLTVIKGADLNINKILEEIAKQAVAIVGFEPDLTDTHRCFSHVGIVEGAKLIFKAACPEVRILNAISIANSQVIDLTDLPVPTTIAAQAVLQRKTINIPDVKDAPAYFVRLNHKTRSQISVPILLQDRAVGVISIEHPAYDAFDNEDVKNVEALAAWAASAIKSTRMLNTIEKMTLTSTIGDPSSTLNTLADGIKDATKCDLVLIYRYDDIVSKVVYPPAHTGLKLSTTGDRDLLSIPHPSILNVAHQTPYYVIDDTKTNEYFKDYELLIQEGIKSFVTFPLIMSGIAQGILFVGYYSSHSFSKDEVSTISILANHASSAMYNILLLHKERQAKQQADSLRDISIAVTSKVDLETIGQHILNELRRVIGYKKATMQLLRRGEYREIIAKNFPNDLVSDHLLRPLSEDALARTIIESGEIKVISDTRESNEWDSTLDETKDVLSWIGIPLVYRNEAIGFLTLDHDLPNSYSLQHKELLSPFANQAAFAIGNARLQGELNALNQVLQAVHEMGREIAYQAIEDFNLEKLFEYILQCFNRLFPEAENFYIARYDHHSNKISFPLVADNQTRVNQEGEWATREPNGGMTEYILENSIAVLLPEKGITIVEWLNKHQIKTIGEMAMSWAGVPLTIADHTIGVIAVQDYTNPHEFDEGTIEILKAFASQIAVAIEYSNSRALFNDLVKFITELYRVRDEEEIVVEVVFRLIEMLDCDAAGLCMLENDELVVKEAISRQGPVLSPRGTRISRGDEMVWKAIDTQKLTSGQVIPSSEPAVRFCYMVESEIVAPLFRDELVIGVLKVENIDWKRFERRKAWTITLLELFADVASASLIMVRYAEQDRRVREFLTLADSVIVGGALARSVLHELNNGLATIDTNLFVISEHLQAQQGLKEQTRILKLISGARDHLEKVSVDPKVVAFSGRLQPTYKLVIFNKIVQDTLLFIDSMLKRQNISYEYDYDQKLWHAPAVYVDEAQIRQVIINLVLNAIDAYHGEGSKRPQTSTKTSDKSLGKLVFRTVLERNQARLEIEDFASGISTSVASQLFEPFVTSKQDGAGLGLYVSRIIIEGNHKGKIFYQSKNLGTIFIFTLPLTKQL